MNRSNLLGIWIAGITLAAGPAWGQQAPDCSQLAYEIMYGEISFSKGSKMQCRLILEGQPEVTMTYLRYCSRTTGIPCDF